MGVFPVTPYVKWRRRREEKKRRKEVSSVERAGWEGNHFNRSLFHTEKGKKKDIFCHLSLV